EISWIHYSQRQAERLGRPSSRSMLPGELSLADESDVANIVVIEPRALIRECLIRSLKQISNGCVSAFADVDSFIAVSPATVSFLVLCTGTQKSEAVQKTLIALAEIRGRIPIIVLSDFDDPTGVLVALNCGARGYIPTNVSLEVAIEAMRLVKAGG